MGLSLSAVWICLPVLCSPFRYFFYLSLIPFLKKKKKKSHRKSHLTFSCSFWVYILDLERSKDFQERNISQMRLSPNPVDICAFRLMRQSCALICISTMFIACLAAMISIDTWMKKIISYLIKAWVLSHRIIHAGAEDQ